MGKKKGSKQFSDGLQNAPMRVGSLSSSLFNQSYYTPTFVTLSRQQLEFQYQTSWVCSLMVDLLAIDMTRQGIEIRASRPEISQALSRSIQRKRIWKDLTSALKWARLFGGAIAVMLIDGDDMTQPLGEVRKGTFKGLYVFDRWQVQPSTERVQTLGTSFGTPVYYELFGDAADIQVEGNKIHHSRVLRFDGRELPYFLRRTFQGWGGSILDPIADRVKAFDLATESAAQLISKAYIRYYRVKGLREILTNERYRVGFEKQIEAMRQFQSNEGMTVGDIGDDFQVFNYTFTGLPELLIQFGQQISGACGIPLVRLFGQSPAGLNSTGESDFRNYYDNVKNLQEVHLRPALERLLSVMHQSLFGEKPDADFDFDFAPLWQLNQSEKSAAVQAQAGTVVQAMSAGAISTSTALKELKSMSDTLGVFASITDEDIQEAEEQDNGMMPPDPSMMGANGAEDIPRVSQNEKADELVHQTPPAGGGDNRLNRAEVQGRARPNPSGGLNP